MPTTKECERNAELCLKLASETKEIYAKIALLELAKVYRARTDHMEARSARELN
jgi:predicted negative regulator of RcsB-dependent stress response